MNIVDNRRRRRRTGNVKARFWSACSMVLVVLVAVLFESFQPNAGLVGTRDAGGSAGGGVVGVAPGGDTAAEALNALPVKGRAPKTGYQRENFGHAWADVDHNGCDTRDDILRRDLKDVVFKQGTGDCKVVSGTLDDPYTATSIYFKKGKKTSDKVQIDHVVALSNAWQTGAQKLNDEQRMQFANDPYNLLAVDGPSNQLKGDADAATWLPENKSYRCSYVSRQIGVKHKYGLWVTSSEKAAMQQVLAICPTQTIPDDDGPFAGRR